MRNTFIFFLLTSTISTTHLSAQSWVVGGNTLSTDGRFGTNNNYGIIIETNNTERARITSSGAWGIGTTSPASKFAVTSASGTSPFRAQVAGATKLLVSGNGSVTIGANTAGPANGLYVAGKVGIGITAPVALLDLLNPVSTIGINVKNNFTGNSDRAAVYAHSVNNPGYGYGVRAYGGWYGVYGEAQGGSFIDFAYGVYGKATGTAGTRYGVYGTASGGTVNAAGYFNGAVWATSYKTISDRKFKESIAPLEHILQQVMKLKPAAYQFKTEAYKNMQLPAGKQLGLIADEVKEVFPELVQQAIHPAEYDQDNKSNVISPEVKYEGINYQGLIPILIAAVQELKTENDQQQQMIEQLKNEITNLKKGGNINTYLSSAQLSEMSPNPVKSTASIQYALPERSTRAQLLITDALGRQIKVIQLTTSGVINVDVSALASGVYNYSLIVDNQTIATRKMTVVK
jgi:hypothetical protein